MISHTSSFSSASNCFSDLQIPNLKNENYDVYMSVSDFSFHPYLIKFLSLPSQILLFFPPLIPIQRNFTCRQYVSYDSKAKYWVESKEAKNKRGSKLPQ